jgi:Calx-beta domain/Tectonin domain/Fibronectin type III domain
MTMGGTMPRALSGIWRPFTAITAIAAVIAVAPAAGSALAATTSGVSAPVGVARPAAAPVASPAIYAPPDVVAGEADGQVNLAVTLSAPGESTVTLAYQTSNGTANGSFNNCQFANSAFVNTSGTLTFPPGVTTQTVTVTLLDCHQSLPSGFLNFYLSLGSNSADSSIARPVTQVDITGDAAAVSTPGLYVRNAIADAHAGKVQVPVVLGGPSGLAQGVPVTVHYSTHDGTAKTGTDYTAVSGTLTFPPGETARNITVPILNRAGAAAARSFSVTLDSPSNATVAYGTGVVTIGASGAAAVASPRIYAPPDMVVGEADGYVDLPVTLSAPGQSTVTVTYQTSNGTANGSFNNCEFANSAFVVGSGKLTFAPGVTTQTIRVPVLNCVQSLPSGFLNLYLSLGGNSTDSSIARAVSQVDITGDQSAASTPGLSVRDATVDAHAGSVQVPVVLGGPSGLAQGVPVTVHYSTHDGSAKAGTDYSAVSGTLTFPPGETAQNITVPILNRTAAAAARSFSVTLTAPSSATVADGTGIVTIGANGAAAVASPFINAPPNMTVGEADGYVDLPVTLSAPGQSAVIVTYQTSNGTANGSFNSCEFANSAFVNQAGTLTFAPGVTTQTVRVPILDCTTSSPLTFNFALGPPTGGRLGVATATITIVLSAKKPGAPSGVTAIPGNQTATVRFAAPGSDGGNPVNSYKVTASPGGATATGFSSPITVTGLHNGTVYTFKVTAANAIGTGPASAASNPVLPENFAAKPGTATDISVGANGAVWAVGSANVSGGHPIYQWNGSKWVTVAGGAVAIAVDPHGNPWIINSSHKIFRRSGTKWVAVPGTATGISIGANGAVWAVGTASISGGHPVLRWNGSKWVTVTGAAAVAIAVDPHGDPWIVSSGHKISHWSGTKWVAVSGAATDIAVGASGSVWDVGTDTVTGGHSVSERIGSGWVKSPGAAVKIAVDQHGNPWIANSSHHIFLG